jgi:glycosyltransferase involved in cell wall biosynthesis
VNTIKKILFIHHGKGLGGAPLSLLYLIQALDTTRYKPVVLFLYDSEIIDVYKAHGIEVYGPTNTMDFSHTVIWWFRWYHLPYLIRSIGSTIKTLLRTANFWLDQINPDIVHLNTSSLIAWGIIARRKGIPVVWHIREPLAKGYLGIRKQLVRTIVGRYATAIVQICHNDAKPWQNKPKTNVIFNAVDPGRFDATRGGNDFCQQYNLNPNHPIILFVGGLSQEKGTLPILNIAKQVIKYLPQTQLVIAGQGNFTRTATGIRRLFPA